ncbi:hypothetical protein NEDG_00565 [Nematocida displodere]|uniref:ubiquitinyl hydrolase 1 n=1 Tax=Nematocida displodere TaxID=1805483 RepID=A0A177EE56_9MICR|nr:hypothetical protein NEDG_00565 [Nematocida displodere]
MNSANANECKQVGNLQELKTLVEQYRDTPVQAAIEELVVLNAKIRKIKGDGNCFYFSAIFLVLEHFLSGPGTPSQLLDLLQGVNGLLKESGVEEYLIEEFSDPMFQVVKCASSREAVDLEALDSIFWDHTLMYFRMITSAYIKTHRAEFEGFLEKDLVEYCQAQVEVTNEYADEIELEGFSRAFNISFEIISICDGQIRKFIKGESSISIGSLLFTAQHYDIIYCPTE